MRTGIIVDVDHWRKLVAKQWHWTFPLVMILTFITIKILVGITKGRVDITGSYTIQCLHYEFQFLFAMFDRDMGIICLYFSMLCLVLAVIPKKLHKLAIFVFLCVEIALLTIAVMELIYFLQTGQNGTATLARYFLSDFVVNLQLIKNYIGIYTITGFALSIIFFVTYKKYVSSKPIIIPWGNSPYITVFTMVIFGTYLLSPYSPQPIDPHYSRLNRDVFDGLVRDVVSNPSYDANKKALSELQTSGVPKWYSSDMTLLKSDKMKKTNIVIVMLESLRAKSTSLHDPPLGTTPFLLELAKHSAMVEQMYVVIPRTSSAWISVLNGMYPISDIAARPWVAGQVINPRQKSLPELLRPHGYSSAFFVATDLAIDNEADIAKNMRFDTLRTAKDFHTNGGSINGWGVPDDVMLKPIEKWIGSQTEESRPFFLTVMTNVGHAPYETPKSWSSREFIKDRSKKDLNDYLNCVAYGDDFLRRLFGIISDAGLADSTVFVVLGDHGQGLGEHQSFGMRTMHEECLHIPMLIYAPEFEHAPIRIHGPRQQVDILPTIADLLGLRIDHAQLPGVSLLTDVPANRPLYFMGSIDDSYLALLQGKDKYIYHFGRSPVEMFDLRLDPEELKPKYGGGMTGYLHPS